MVVEGWFNGGRVVGIEEGGWLALRQRFYNELVSMNRMDFVQLVKEEKNG